MVGIPRWVADPATIAGEGLLQRALYDERFPESVAFANELNRRGVLTAGVRGDIAALWYQDLQILLRRAREPIAGLTDRATLFCLEELTRDVGMKVSVRVDHTIDKNGYVQHQAVGPAPLVEVTRELRPEQEFGRDMAVLLDSHDVRRPVYIAAQKRTGPFSAADQTALVSWTIA
jgi:hypothetical protein